MFSLYLCLYTIFLVYSYIYVLMCSICFSSFLTCFTQCDSLQVHPCLCQCLNLVPFYGVLRLRQLLILKQVKITHAMKTDAMEKQSTVSTNDPRACRSPVASISGQLIQEGEWLCCRNCWIFKWAGGTRLTMLTSPPSADASSFTMQARQLVSEAWFCKHLLLSKREHVILLPAVFLHL